MKNKRRILIIENQFIQFKDITKLLDREGYDSFPDVYSFKEYIDAIKINLNPRYTNDRRKSFLEKAIEVTNQFNPEILIIDHILVGTHDAQDGIDLAIKFRENNLNQPILFFSRTELNNIDVCDKLPKVNLLKEWVFKGYSGDDILNPDYFKKEVIKRIEELLSKSKIENSELYIINNLVPFVTELLKIKLEANSRAADSERSTSIALLEQLKQTLNDFSSSQKVITKEIESEFSNLKSVTSEGHFEDEKWKSACNNLIIVIDKV
jgi:hypothetical protein